MSKAVTEIAPGSKINVKVVKKPTSAAAAKTIVRLLSKDRGVKAENARLRRARKNHLDQKQRGGRFWDINVPKQEAVTADLGVEKTIVASPDVITDLKSVSKFVEVAKA